MSLTVGTDTYISQVDATTYITAQYVSSTPEYIEWSALSSGDKDVWLRKAYNRIESQKFCGEKFDLRQTQQFPRAYRTENDIVGIYAAYIYQSGWYVQASVPDDVKNAQVEEALVLLQGIPARLQLQMQGVKSMSLGDLSESYEGMHNTKVIEELYSTEAKRIMQPYMLRAVRIR